MMRTGTLEALAGIAAREKNSLGHLEFAGNRLERYGFARDPTAQRRRLPRLNPSILCVAFLGVVPAAAARGQTVIYVDDSATNGLNNGTSWADAYIYLQDALPDPGPPGGPVEIRVAQGVYKPDQGAGQTSGDRTATFRVLNGVSLMGGYAGIGAPDPDLRDINSNASVLSGDLNGDDGPDFANNADNSEHVVKASSISVTAAVLDGFTITAGNAVISDNRSGGGLRFDHAPLLTIVACRFAGNYAENHGGGLSGQSGACPSLIDCTFEDNQAVSSGGGMSCSMHFAGPSLTRCTFARNTARGGGGLSLDDATSAPETATLTRCVFSQNTATAGQGGGLYAQLTDVVVTDCTFTENSAAHFAVGVAHGGGAYVRTGTDRFSGCSFIANHADNASGGGLAHEDGGLILTDSVFRDNVAKLGGGLSTGDIFPLFPGTTTVVAGCLFSGNNADWGSGGGVAIDGQSPTLVNCVFTGNAAYARGGAVNIMESFLDSAPVITNCTIAANSALTGGGVRSGNGDILAANSVLWGNQDAAGVGESAQLAADGSGSVSIHHSVIQGLDAYSTNGAGNIGDDPMFANPLGPDGVAGTEDDDLRLLPESPCINAGSNGALPPDVADLNSNGDTAEPIPFDLDGNPRVVGCAVDMGAYEYQVAQPLPGDFDSNCVIDLVDFGVFQFCLTLSGPESPPSLQACINLFDFNGDTDVDAEDFAAFQLVFDVAD